MQYVRLCNEGKITTKNEHIGRKQTKDIISQ